jgi:hypothetical protein
MASVVPALVNVSVGAKKLSSRVDSDRPGPGTAKRPEWAHFACCWNQQTLQDRIWHRKRSTSRFDAGGISAMEIAQQSNALRHSTYPSASPFTRQISVKISIGLRFDFIKRVVGGTVS